MIGYPIDLDNYYYDPIDGWIPKLNHPFPENPALRLRKGEQKLERLPAPTKNVDPPKNE